MGTWCHVALFPFLALIDTHNNKDLQFFYVIRYNKLCLDKKFFNTNPNFNFKEWYLNRCEDINITWMNIDLSFP